MHQSRQWSRTASDGVPYSMSRAAQRAAAANSTTLFAAIPARRPARCGGGCRTFLLLYGWGRNRLLRLRVRCRTQNRTENQNCTEHQTLLSNGSAELPTRNPTGGILRISRVSARGQTPKKQLLDSNQEATFHHTSSVVACCLTKVHNLAS